MVVEVTASRQHSLFESRQGLELEEALDFAARSDVEGLTGILSVTETMPSVRLSMSNERALHTQHMSRGC